MLAALDSAATLYGSAFSFLGEATYFPQAGQFRNSKGQIKSIRQFFTRSPQYQGELSLAKTTSSAAKVVGNGFAAVSFATTFYGYYLDGKATGGNHSRETNIKFGMDIGVNAMGLYNAYGAAANVGWEMGRLITTTNGYQNFKHNHVLKTHGGRDGLLSTDY